MAERRKLQLVRSSGRKLHAGHFAFMRALVEGLDLDKSWDRYLATEGSATDKRVKRSTIAWIRSEFAAAAKRENKPGTARLVLLNLGGPTEDAPAPASKPTAKAPPTLEEFVQAIGMEDFSEAEQIERYVEEYGKASQEDPKERTRLQRRARLIKRQLLALDWLEQSVSQLPAGGDSVEAWFAPSLAGHLKKAGLHTLFLLAERINGVGWRWWTVAPGIGELKGARITEWMKLHADSTYLPIGEHALIRRSEADPGQLALVVRPATDLVPLEKFKVPAELDGSQGAFRAERSLLSASNDYDAITAWLATKQEQPNTQRAYRREAERLLLWTVLERGKAMSSLTTEDAMAFMAFLKEPPARWCAPRHLQRWSPLWRPLEGPLKAPARQQAQRILSGLFNFLMKQSYMIGNPFSGVTPPKVPVRPLGSGRTLTRDQWAALEAVAAEDKSLLGRRRARALHWLYATGLRTAELCAAKCGDLEAVDYIDATGAQRVGWILNVIGKGTKHRGVVVPSSLVDEFQRDLADHGKGTVTDEANKGLAILADLDKDDQGNKEGWTPSGLYKAMKRVMQSAAATMDGPNAERLMAASTHWLRHSHASHGLNSGAVSLMVARQNMGHASLNTLSEYLTTERDVAIREIEKFAGGKKPHE